MIGDPKVSAPTVEPMVAVPMLMITGQKPIKKSKQGRFQIIDVHAPDVGVQRGRFGRQCDRL